MLTISFADAYANAVNNNTIPHRAQSAVHINTNPHEAYHARIRMHYIQFSISPFNYSSVPIADAEQADGVDRDLCAANNIQTNKICNNNYTYFVFGSSTAIPSAYIAYRIERKKRYPVTCNDSSRKHIFHSIRLFSQLQCLSCVGMGK